MKRAHNVEDLRTIVAASATRREVLEALGLKPAGGNYKMLKRTLEAHQIDTSHFNGRGWSRGKTLGPRRNVLDSLTSGSKVSSHALRNRLLHAGIFEARCYGCDRTTWLGHPIPLELEHINGVHEDNRLENLTILCPNCHALTPTYRSKNRAKVAADQAVRREVPKSMACQVCGSPCIYKFCSPACVHLAQRKADRPSKEELASLVGRQSLCAIGRQYGVSDNAVRKWLRAYGLR
jgi:hypothetical protein